MTVQATALHQGKMMNQGVKAGQVIHRLPEATITSEAAMTGPAIHHLLQGVVHLPEVEEVIAVAGLQEEAEVPAINPLLQEGRDNKDSHHSGFNREAAAWLTPSCSLQNH
jgi:hypothetical protein